MREIERDRERLAHNVRRLCSTAEARLKGKVGNPSHTPFARSEFSPCAAWAFQRESKGKRSNDPAIVSETRIRKAEGWEDRFDNMGHSRWRQEGYNLSISNNAIVKCSGFSFREGRFINSFINLSIIRCNYLDAKAKL